MAQGYTKADLIEKIDEIIKDEKQTIGAFYNARIINSPNRTIDTAELYTEIIAEWLLQNLDVLKQIPTIERIKGYGVKTHTGQTAAMTSNRAEERIALALFNRRTFQSIGNIVDYQTPLKNTRYDVVGKIDLLSCDGKIVRILELKKPDYSGFINGKIVRLPDNKDQPESMLRCVLEGYTYLHTIKNQSRFIESFDGIPSGAVLKTSPLVFMGSTQWKQMYDPDYKFLRQLMDTLDIQPFYITGDCEANFDIVP